MAVDEVCEIDGCLKEVKYQWQAAYIESVEDLTVWTLCAEHSAEYAA